MRSKDLGINQIRSLMIGKQSVVLWRSSAKQVYALDAYCPHMGTHFSKGKVVGENIRCFFHHWQFDGEGKCQDIPAAPAHCSTVKTQSYAVTEKYESLWIFPRNKAPAPLAEFEELLASDVEVVFDQSYTRSCHHHVTMINGIDAQHLKTVHNIDIEMNVSIQENTRQIEIVLTGEIGKAKFSERLARKIIGSTYSYAMKYDHASTGLLTLLKNSFWLGKLKKTPSLHMIFAFRPMEDGKSFVQPMFITKKRRGLIGRAQSALLLWLTKRAFRSLQGEDGEVYDNMRFHPGALLPVDRPVVQYIQYVNRLPSSAWGSSR